MIRFSITRALGDAFDLIGRKPAVVLLWGVMLTAPYLLLLPMAGGFVDMMRMADADADGMPDQMLAGMMAFQGAGVLMNVLQMVALVFVAAAVLRAILFPEASKRAWLRAGMDEVRIAVVGVALFVGLYLAILLVVLMTLPFAIVMFGRGGEPSPSAMVGISLVPLLGMIGMLVLAARAALIAPATIAFGEFGFAPGWAMGKGRWLKLVGLVLSQVLMMMLLQLLFAAVMIGLAVLVWSLGGFGDLAAVWRSSEPQNWAIDWPRLILVSVIFYPLIAMMTGVGQVMGLAPLASAWRQLRQSPAER